MRGARFRRAQAGEVWIKGPMVVPGYWANDAATRESFTAGFWRSGDVGRLDAAGYLRIEDRIKDMINRAGYKVFSVEVEQRALRASRRSSRRRSSPSRIRCSASGSMPSSPRATVG